MHEGRKGVLALEQAQIGVIAYALDRAPGGIGRYTTELIDALDRAGVDLAVLQAGGGRRPEALPLPGKGLLPELMTIGQVAIAWLARRRRLDLIHDPTGVVPLLLTRTRRIATIHDAIPYIYPQTSSRLDWLIYRFWLPLVVAQLDAVLTVSEQSKRDIARHLPIGAEKIVVIPEAASAHYRPLPEREVRATLQQYRIECPYILYVGALEARKNLPRLLQAYAQLRQWTSKWTLVIVGARKWKTSPIFETVQALGLAPHVHFTGYVAEEDLPALYNGADCFVFPSLYEGFGLPVLEAMACGTPVITSNVSSLPEVAGDAAVLIDPYDVAQIAHALWLVLSQPALAAALRNRGLARAQSFSWERTARETAAVYAQVLDRPVPLERSAESPADSPDATPQSDANEFT